MTPSDEALRLAQTPRTEDVIETMKCGRGVPVCDEWDTLENHARTLERELNALRAESERLQGELNTAQHWRERHCRESEANAKQSGENWQKWKAAESLAERLRAELARKQHDADMLAAAVDKAVRAGALDARSEIADCRLDYGHPFTPEEVEQRLSKRRPSDPAWAAAEKGAKG